MIPRRVRCDMVVRERWTAYVIVQRPRIVSTCNGRAPIWEWFNNRAVELCAA